MFNPYFLLPSSYLSSHRPPLPRFRLDIDSILNSFPCFCSEPPFHSPYKLVLLLCTQCTADLFFFTIKLLLLLFPSAARITWAEQALLNIEQDQEGGRPGETRWRKEGRIKDGDGEKKTKQKTRGGLSKNLKRKEKNQHSKTLISGLHSNRCPWLQGSRSALVLRDLCLQMCSGAHFLGTCSYLTSTLTVETLNISI